MRTGSSSSHRAHTSSTIRPVSISIGSSPLPGRSGSGVYAHAMPYTDSGPAYRPKSN